MYTHTPKCTHIYTHTTLADTYTWTYVMSSVMFRLTNRQAEESGCLWKVERITKGELFLYTATSTLVYLIYVILYHSIFRCHMLQLRHCVGLINWHVNSTLPEKLQYVWTHTVDLALFCGV